MPDAKSTVAANLTFLAYRRRSDEDEWGSNSESKIDCLNVCHPLLFYEALCYEYMYRSVDLDGV